MAAATQSVNDAKQVGTEFLWRRLEEKPEIFGYPMDFDPMWWLAIGIPLVCVTLVFVYWMYARESKAIGLFWAGFLALFRTLTIVSLFFIWLLPAVREVETTEQRSKALVLFDVSGSMQRSDAADFDTPGLLHPTRQEQVIESLRPGYTPPGANKRDFEKRDFLGGLLKNNPLYCYRFGERLDPNALLLTEAQWTPEVRDATARELARMLQPSPRATLAEPISPDLVKELSKAAEELRKAKERGLEGKALEQRQKEIVDGFERSVGEQQQIRERLLNRTNYGSAALELLRKESGNMVQALIVVGDGRNNAGSSEDLRRAVDEAKKQGILVFSIGVGQHSEAINLRLVDVLAPGRIQPEDDFPVRVVVEGENLPKGQEVEITLNVEKPDGQLEAFTEKVTLTDTTARLSTGAHEFIMKKPPGTVDGKPMRWPLGEFHFRALVKAVPRERTRGDNKSEKVVKTAVDERKLNILIVAGAPMRDYQFLRTLLVREKEKFDIFLHFQPYQEGTVQDLDEKHMLDHFPDRIGERDADKYNLANYDVVICFDPDWRKVLRDSPNFLKPTDLKDPNSNLLRTWLDKFAGGLIVVAGPVNTFNLAREKDLKPIRDLYPVDLDDGPSSFTVMDRKAKDPWALNWGQNLNQFPFMNLTDTDNHAKFLDGWEEFFWKANPDRPFEEQSKRDNNKLADTPAFRGFFSFFPLKEVKPAAHILARFSDPNKDYLMSNTGKRAGERQPFFVIHNVGTGPVFYIGSGEVYRLRSYNEKFHERFWTKLIRYMGKGDATKGSRRGLVVVGSRYNEGDTVEVEAQILDTNMQPLRPDDKSKVLLQIVPPKEVADAPKEWSNPGLEMKSTGREGWFAVRFPVKKAGEYAVEVVIPGSVERLKGGFRVFSTDPELDQARPDYALLHRLASPVQVLDEKRRQRPEIDRALRNSKAAMLAMYKQDPAGGVQLPAENKQDRLFFRLEDATWIPELVDPNVVPFRTEGKIRDLWDKGWMVFADLDHPDKAAAPPVESTNDYFSASFWREFLVKRGLPWALVLVVLLLSVEWLTRKLLRLA